MDTSFPHPCVERGYIFGVDEVFTKTFVPAYHDQKSMKLEFYCSPEKDAWYVTGKRGNAVALQSQ